MDSPNFFVDIREAGELLGRALHKLTLPPAGVDAPIDYLSRPDRREMRLSLKGIRALCDYIEGSLE